MYYVMASGLDLEKPASTSASHSVGLPVHGTEMSRLGRSHHQVLHVPPGQVHTARTQKGKQSRVHLLSAVDYLEVLLSTFMHIMKKARFC